MANFIPYTLDNMFLWYEGNDKDRATPFNGINFNKPIKQLEANDEKLDTIIFNILNGNEKFEKILTEEIEIENKLQIGTINITFDDNNIYIKNKDDENEIKLETGYLSTKEIELNGLDLTFDGESLNVKSDDNYKNLKINDIYLQNINIADTLISVTTETINDETYYFLDYKASDYDHSVIRSGTFYALKSYYNFGSNDLQDAIVFDDSDDSDTANGFLFYADGEVKNSTLYAGEYKSVGGDIAEFYDADKKYKPGTILEIGGKKEVTEFNGGPLAGVASEIPGQTLNAVNNFRYPVLIALKGRVKVNIIGFAEKGDYIVAYKNGKGIAKKRNKLTSNDQIVGIALENGKNQVLIKV